MGSVPEWLDGPVEVLQYGCRDFAEIVFYILRKVYASIVMSFMTILKIYAILAPGWAEHQS